MDYTDIKDYKTTHCLIPKSIYSWVIVFTLILLTFLIIIFNFDYDYYYNTKATYVKNNSMLRVSVINDDISKITDNNKLIIKNKEYEYDVNKITNQLTQGLVMEQYSDIILDLRLDKQYKIENNLIDIKIKYDSKKIFEVIKDFILGRGN